MNEREFLQELCGTMDAHREAYLVTVIAVKGSTPQKAGAKMLVFPDGTIRGTIGGGAVELRLIHDVMAARPAEPQVVRIDLGDDLAAGDDPGMLCGGTMEFFIEPLGRGAELYIIGGGHCAMELSALAARTDFAVTVIDPRPEWANREKHPAARVICAAMEDVAQHIRFTPETYIVVMTHNHEGDEVAVRNCLPHEARYLGMLGSRKKTKQTKDNLQAQGFDDQVLARLHAPIGVPIGSHTPAEIAVSIMAELIGVRNGASTEF